MKANISCPKCGSQNYATERRPDGDHICGNCQHRWKNVNCTTPKSEVNTKATEDMIKEIQEILERFMERVENCVLSENGKECTCKKEEAVTALVKLFEGRGK